MIRSSTQPIAGPLACESGGFTMIELLVVIIILPILIGLLLPAINAAMRTAKNAAVPAEINQLAPALESFRSKYGDYPPAASISAENGLLPVGASAHQSMATPNDITDRQLCSAVADRPAQVLPEGRLQHLGRRPRSSTAPTFWYDFNGNGIMDDALHPRGPRVPGLLPGGIPIAGSDDRARSA